MEVRKKKVQKTIFGLLPNCLVKKKNCIATLQLYCKREGWKKKIVLELYYKRMHVAVKLYCNIVVQWAENLLQ